MKYSVGRPYRGGSAMLSTLGDRPAARKYRCTGVDGAQDEVTDGHDDEAEAGPRWGSPVRPTTDLAQGTGVVSSGSARSHYGSFGSSPNISPTTSSTAAKGSALTRCPRSAVRTTR